MNKAVPLRVGDQIDRYSIVSMLGKGGMGEIYEALDSRLQRRAALSRLTRFAVALARGLLVEEVHVEVGEDVALIVLL
jgi:serine/threonine protein kinase